MFLGKILKSVGSHTASHHSGCSKHDLQLHITAVAMYSFCMQFYPGLVGDAVA